MSYHCNGNKKGPLGWYLPTTICGALILIAALLTLSLPETGASQLTDHVEEVPSSSTNSAISSIDEHSKNINTKDKNDRITSRF